IFTFAPGTFSTDYLMVNLRGNVPTLTNVTFSAVGTNGVTFNATVIPNGPSGGVALAWFAYGLTTNYGNFSGTNSFSSAATTAVAIPVTGLQPNAVYHYRAFASNNVALVSGDDMTFIAEALPPTLQLQSVSGLTATSAVVNAQVNPNQQDTIVTVLWGLTSGYGQTNSTSIGNGTNPAPFSFMEVNLAAGTTYHYAILASNLFGTVSSGDQTAITSAGPPVAVTLTAFNVTATNASLSGTVNPEGANSGWYFEYGTNVSYGSSTSVGLLPSTNVAMAVSNVISGLLPGVTYHFRLVATNALGTNTGGDGILTAQALAPVLAVGSVTGLTATNAALNAQVTPNGAATVVWFNWGLSSNYDHTIITNAGSGNVPVSVSGAVTGLAPYTVYHYAVIASNTVGTVASVDQTFTTQPGAPDVTTLSAADIAATNATLTGAVNPNGLATGWYFAYGPTTNYGSTTTTGALPIGNVSVNVTNIVSGLNPATTYHFRLIATNALGTNAGADLSFSTAVAAPYVVPGPVTGIGLSNATLNAQVTANGTNTTVWFNWGSTSNYDHTAITNAGSDNVPASLSSVVTNLAIYTVYHYAIVASNALGGVSSGDLTFTTLAAAPDVVTLPAFDITATNATLNGTINPNGSAAGWYFAYGPTTNYGSTTAIGVLASGNAPVLVTNLVSGLNPATTYHFRLVATNALGTNYGTDLSFNSAAMAPTLVLGPVTGISFSNATLNAQVTPNGAGTLVFFNWGLTTNYGSTTTVDAGNGIVGVPVSAALANLNLYTLYHYQVIASNSFGAIASGDQTFITLNTNSLAAGPLTAINYWRMGENDAGAVADAGATALVDNVRGQNLTIIGAGAYYSSDAALSSSLALRFTNAVSYALSAVPTNVNNNFGVEGWFKPTASGNTTMMYNGNGGNSGWGFLQSGSNYQILMGGVAFFGSAPVTLNAWTHLALVCDNGVSTFYVNGISAGSIAAIPNPAAGGFAIGADVGGGSHYFNGLVDEVRIFTFAPGTFSTNYLLLNPQSPGPLYSNVVAGPIRTNGATLNAVVAPNAPAGGSAQIWFEYGTTTNYGNVTGTNIVLAGAAQSVSNVITGLQPFTQYHFRAHGSNNVAASVSTDQTFNTTVLAPTIDLQPVTGLGVRAATINARVTPTEADTVVSILWGLTAGYGNTNATDIGLGMNPVPVSDALTNLAVFTVYHYQVVASNSEGMVSSGDQTFITLSTNVSLVNGPLTAINYWRMGESDP
ncbi:MAG TPA: LamG domain-containing protein, partial [Desulfuromonadaceae bacterium]|nr:LamG domain-containing protein [Desulfuromonadaceae bacterium]